MSDNDNLEKKPPVREPADYVEAIGPEDLPADETVDRLHEAGFEKMDEDNFESDPTSVSDMPNTWLAEEDKIEPADEAEESRDIQAGDYDVVAQAEDNDDEGTDRPVEDAVIEE